MAKLEFVAGIVDALEAMKNTIAETPLIVAEEFLEATLVDSPTPPRDTGGLRKSAAAYIGGKLVATAESLAAHGKSGGVRSRVTQDMLGPRLLSSVDGLVRATTTEVSDAAPAITKTITGKSLAGGSRGTSRKLTAGSLFGKVTVKYTAHHAALMHEWTGKLHEPGSGPAFISSKMFQFGSKARFRIRAVHKSNMVRVRRR